MKRAVRYGNVNIEWLQVSIQLQYPDRIPEQLLDDVLSVVHTDRRMAKAMQIQKLVRIGKWAACYDGVVTVGLQFGDQLPKEIDVRRV